MPEPSELGPTDSWITLAGLARETRRIRLGTLVSAATFRHPGPFALAGLSADALLDPANPVLEPGAVAPVLGLGFGIRLAAGLIEASGGAFAIESECIRIVIPAIAKTDRTP